MKPNNSTPGGLNALSPDDHLRLATSMAETNVSGDRMVEHILMIHTHLLFALAKQARRRQT